jgi:hypothetical protein
MHSPNRKQAQRRFFSPLEPYTGLAENKRLKKRGANLELYQLSLSPRQ